MIKKNKLKITMLAFGMFFLAGVSSVKADADYNNALLSAPRALTLNNLFQTGTGAGVSTSSGTVSLNGKNEVALPGQTVVKTLVKVTDDKNQKAAVWSTDNNAFDINTSGKSAMWIYLGERGTSAGDGMALVLQNDPKGNAAISSNAGETLGVWADDNSSNMLGSAIQNSWALEFDTYMNKGTNRTGAFDYGLSGSSHIASGYPADTTTYPSKAGSGYKQKHDGLISFESSLSNGAWHHVTVDYKSTGTTTGTMTYNIDDKAPISEYKAPSQSPAEYRGTPVTVPIDKTKFKSTNGKIRWGFTGSTGASYETNLVMFEQVPGLVNATAEQTVTDITQNNKDISNGGEKVKSGDKLKFTIKGTYLNGQQDWKDVRTQLKYPAANMKWTEFVDQNGLHYDLPSDLLGNTPPDSELENLSTSEPTKEISFYGTVQPVKVDTEEESSGQLIGTNALVDYNTVKYTIEAAPTTVLTIDDLKDIDVNYGSDATVSGTVKSSLGGLLAKGAKVDVTVNNETTPIKADVGTDGKFSVTVPKDKYKAGENTVTVQATDAAGIQTVKYTNKINIHPVLTLNDNNGTVIAPYTFNFQVVDNSADITTYYKEGASGTPVQLEKYANAKPGSTQDHKVDLDTSKLSIGTHVLTVYSVDTEGNTSNNQTITVIVGLLSISSDDSINFKNQIPAKTSVLSRTADYTLKLETSAAKNWTLSVTAGALTAKSDNSTLQHSTVGFRDTKDKSFTPLSPTIGTTIDSGTGQAATITKKWATDAGIVLNVVPSEIKADEVYTSQINWTLTNTPVN